MSWEKPRADRVGYLSLANLLVYLLLATLLLSSCVQGLPRTYNELQHEEIALICRNPEISFFDYSAKAHLPDDAPTCPKPSNHVLVSRDVDDYSCSETKPCRNGACCPKATGYCNYGPLACGTNGQSPNEVCWSNCDAFAECGRFAKLPGQTCPLNVCCSGYGFCGSSSDFCAGPTATTPGCQSNCNQPGSGGSKGDVQSRVIGYYAAWAHDSPCEGMDFQDIPVSSITHAHFSFGYISPNTFNVVPMDGLPISLFNDFTAIKSKNPDLKCIVALGGWTFNDNGTATQPVYSTMVSNSANRKTFIQNLFNFLREFAFDGVDFDWEYPGAPDRGGGKDDGPNFTEFLKELHDANSQLPVPYIVSFTTPTSYWYLRGFDLAAVDYVDYVNVMSYDLHGTWDSSNPIGNQILAHTNLTEINQAMDLLWRNKIDPKKINLGLGFYGRSFQLSDPTCWHPGCPFRGGAAPGPCTQNSGTLSYREIMQIIKQNNLNPFYDTTDAVKYIVWNKDQWVSYDDVDTFKQKIDFANNLGLGGLLIWSIDQDTTDLSGLSAVLAPKNTNVFAAKSNDVSYWKQATAQDCFVTDCGGHCDPPFVAVTKQPCGGTTPITKHSTKADSTLCCPIDSVPNPAQCTWRGNWPNCNGQCLPGEATLELNKWGDGKYCDTGNKVYCCKVPAAQDIGCYWTGIGGNCKSGDTLMTFAGTFLKSVANIADLFGQYGQALEVLLDSLDIDLEKRFCCPANEAAKWTNCAWRGTPGSCDDDHCDTGHSVELAISSYGGGQSCAPRFERQRVFCCDPLEGEVLFLPAPLANLFPHPPTDSDADTKFSLEVDDTWGTGIPQTTSDEPNDVSFGFVVLTSPEALQISLDKRDGSRWELFNCEDIDTEEAQTVQMICEDHSENSTSGCGQIHLGHGVPGTILEMPSGCGIGKYAVAVSLEESKSQKLPSHLQKRYTHKPTVYDLTFDYDFRRVPRDLGDTQMRIDFSNEVGYWDAVVAAAASSKKSKRSLDDYGRNHKRWLENEWREDLHFGALPSHDLHKRWFGSDIIDWLRKLVSTGISPSHTHNLDETFTAILVKEEFECPIAGATVTANLLAQAQAHVQVQTTFGITIITTLKPSLDLSQSYMYFANKGKIEAVFTLNALAQVQYQSGDQEIISIPFPGASFKVPGIVTIGPSLAVNVALEAQMTLAGQLEAKLELASWNVRQTYPAQGGAFSPLEMGAPPAGQGTDTIGQPSFDFAVSAKGDITAHLKPTFSFGITFNSQWGIPDCKVDLVADGYVTLYATGELSSQNPDCPFTYGVDVGANLYAHIDAPAPFGWSLGKDRFDITSVPAVQVIKGGSCPVAGSTIQKRAVRIEGPRNKSRSVIPPQEYVKFSTGKTLSKRDPQTWGPILNLNLQQLLCPPDAAAIGGGATCGSPGGGIADGSDDTNARRDLGPVESNVSHINFFDKRVQKDILFCVGTRAIEGFDNVAISPDYLPAGTQLLKTPAMGVFGPNNYQDCTDMLFGNFQPLPANFKTNGKFSTEHVLEFFLFPDFFDYLESRYATWLDPTDRSNNAMLIDFCGYYSIWFGTTLVNMPVGSLPVSGWRFPHTMLESQFPGEGSFSNDWVLLWNDVNGVKSRMWQNIALYDPGDMQKNVDGTVGSLRDACNKVKYVAWALQYHVFVNQILVNQVQRLRNMFDLLDLVVLPNVVATDPTYAFRRNYQQIGIGPYWTFFMNGCALTAKTRAETFLRDWLNAITTKYDGLSPQQQAQTGNLGTVVDNLEMLVHSVLGQWNPQF